MIVYIIFILLENVSQFYVFLHVKNVVLGMRNPGTFKNMFFVSFLALQD